MAVASVSRVRILLSVFLALGLAADVSAAGEIWQLDNTARIGGHAVTLLGSPRISETAGAKALVFDGVADGVLVPSLPFAGATQFTIEILFQPLEGGPAEQRFLHAQDSNAWRALIETRLDGKGGWWLDTFIWTGAPDRGVVLVDPARVHPTGRWYWAALRYDGKTMAHFVNGRKEIERAAMFEPFAAGQISLGVRQNKIHWFKGAIREARFHREALADEKLQRVE